MELYYGAFKSRQVAGNLARIRALEKGVKIWELGRETAEVLAHFGRVPGLRLENWAAVTTA